MNPEDYKRVAETLEHYRDNYAGDQASREFDIAIDLCERFAKSELVERSELDKAEIERDAFERGYDDEMGRIRAEYEAKLVLRDSDLREMDRIEAERDSYKADYGELFTRHAELEAKLKSEYERGKADEAAVHLQCVSQGLLDRANAEIAELRAHRDQLCDVIGEKNAEIERLRDALQVTSDESQEVVGELKADLSRANDNSAALAEVADNYIAQLKKLQSEHAQLQQAHASLREAVRELREAWDKYCSNDPEVDEYTIGVLIIRARVGSP